MWKDHWRLSGDPFLSAGAPYVRTSGHDESVSRLVASIETGERLAVLRAGPGMGKSTILARVAVESKGPHRRFARVVGPVDGPAMLAGLAAGLGASLPGDAGRSVAWKALADAVRLCHWQKLHPVLVIDDCQVLADPADRRDLERLTHLAPNPSARLTVIQSFGDPDVEESPIDERIPAWQFVTRLKGLLRSETVRFVEAKMAAAGRTEPAFTPGALERLHALSGGVPRGIDRLGSLSLKAGALGGLDRVTPDVVDGAAAECALPGPDFAGRAGWPVAARL